jgi:hypothetical protein
MLRMIAAATALERDLEVDLVGQALLIHTMSKLKGKWRVAGDLHISSPVFICHWHLLIA